MYFPTGDTSQRGRGRGAFAMTAVYPNANSSISYIDIASQGTAKDFGDLTAARNQGDGLSNQVRALFAGGNPATDTIDYVTISITGNAIDFGDLTAPGSIGNDGAASDINGGLG